MFVSGMTDRYGRPVVVSRKRLDGSAPAEDAVNLLVYNLEKGLQLAKQTGAWQLVWLIDLNGYSRKNSPPLSTSLKVLRTLTSNYPECLGLGIIVDAPAIFSFLFKALSPFIDARTRSKVHFVKGTPEQKFAKLSQWFEPEQLDRCYGGTREFEYDFHRVEADFIARTPCDLGTPPVEE